MKKLINIRLDLFDGGAAGAAGSGAGTGTGTSGGGNTGANAQAAAAGANRNGSPSGTSPVSARRSRSGAFDNVKFGKQPSAQEAPAAQSAVSSVAGENASTAEKSADATDKAMDPEARRKEYRELVEGKFKDLYQEDTQNIVKQRFKETRDLREKTTKQQAVLDILAQRYGITDGDATKIQEALDKDNGIWADMAAEAGFDDVSKYREFLKLQIETKNLRAADAERRAAEERARIAQQERRYVQEKMDKWATEGDALKATYPDFDLAREQANQEFTLALAFYENAQVSNPVERAYTSVHHAELVEQARAQTEKNVVENIRAKGMRPQENGTQSQSSFTVRDDPHSLTKAERAEIARRAARGEVIRF